MLKTFDLTFNGKPAQITYEDDMPYADFSQILKSSVDLTGVMNGDVKIDVDGYISLVLQKSIKSAPFNPNPQELGLIGRKTMKVIIQEILSAYPLGESLEPWATAMLGNTEQMKLLLESMPSVPANSAGIKQP